MVHALGYCHQMFNPAEPGRLCRGRERWIESWPRDAEAELFRAVISGAAFTDDSARDAHRGLPFSRLTVGRVLAEMLEGRELVAYAEEAPPPLVPEGACDVEHYEHHVMGGALRRWSVRWSLPVHSAEDIDAAIAAGADVFVVAEALDALEELPTLHDPVAPDADADPAEQKKLLPETVLRSLFFLTGFRSNHSLDGSGMDENGPIVGGATGQPTRRFQPAAVPRLLEQVPLLVLVHRDKHGPCLGIYGLEDLEDLLEPLDDLAMEAGALPVPFAIPPMLARWDRALWELRQTWDEAEEGEFPVPPSRDHGSTWTRDRRRRRRHSDDEE